MRDGVTGEIRYPHETKGFGQTIAWFVMIAFAAGILGVGWHTTFNLRWGAGLYFLLLGAFCLFSFGWAACQLTLRNYRARHEIWWLRGSDTGLEINDRLFRPRRFSWRDIDDIAVARFSQAYDDGTTEMVEQVGLLYRQDHPAAHSRRRREMGVDVIIDGPWDRTPDDAVALLRSWRDSRADVPARHIPAITSEISYPSDSRRFTSTLVGLAALGGGVFLLPAGWYLLVNRAGAGTGIVVMTIGLSAIVYGTWRIGTSAVTDFCAARRSWWIRPCSNGFEINDRLSGPRRFAWHDIEDIVATRTGSERNDETTEGVGIRCRPTDPRSDPERREKTGADVIIDGPWLLRPAEAVALLKSWRESDVTG